MTPDDQPATLTDPLTEPDALTLPPVDATQQAAMDQQAAVATGPWAIKPQEVTDKHSGLTLTFGNHADDSNTVFLIVSHKDAGSLLTFHRNGDVLKCQPLTSHPDAHKAAIARAQEAASPNVLTADPADTEGSGAVLGDRHRPEPWRDNRLAPPGTNVQPGTTTPLPDTPLPATE